MKMFRFQALSLYLCLLAPIVKGQHNPASDQSGTPMQTLSSRQLVVQWDSGTFQANQSWANSVTVKYQEKVGRITLIPSTNKAVMVHFQDGAVREEDLLQVLEMEGLPSPYFIFYGRKYLLDQDKHLVNEPVK